MILVFNHEGWLVMTAAWSAAGKPGKQTEVCYQWGADRFSVFESATGIRRVTFKQDIAEFMNVVVRVSGHGGKIVDLRSLQQE